MPRLPIAMFAIKEVLRLHHDAGHTQREISRATGVSQSAILQIPKESEHPFRLKMNGHSDRK